MGNKLHGVEFSGLDKVLGVDISSLSKIYGLDVTQACSEIGVTETFEPTGFDLTGWTINVGAPGPGVIEEDYDASTVTGAPAGWQDQCLQVQRLTSFGTADIERAFPSSAIEYHKFDIILKTGLNFGETLFVWSLESTGTIQNAIQIAELGAGPFFYIYILGGQTAQTGNISTDTVYTIDIRLDRTAEEYEWKINGVLQPNDNDAAPPITVPGTLFAAPVHDKIRIGVPTGTVEVTEYFIDNWQWSSCNWVT